MISAKSCEMEQNISRPSPLEADRDNTHVGVLTGPGRGNGNTSRHPQQVFPKAQQNEDRGDGKTGILSEMTPVAVAHAFNQDQASVHVVAETSTKTVRPGFKYEDAKTGYDQNNVVLKSTGYDRGYIVATESDAKLIVKDCSVLPSRGALGTKASMSYA